MAATNEFRMSAARYEELKKELEYDKTTRADEVSEQIKVARGFGDLSENSEYDEAKNEQGKLYSRIAELENILEHAVIIDENDQPKDQITIGSKVGVINVKTGAKGAYQVVGSQEADPMHGAISEESPFSARLCWARKSVWRLTVEAPVGACVPHRHHRALSTDPKRIQRRKKFHGRGKEAGRGRAEHRRHPENSPGQALSAAGGGAGPVPADQI